MDLVLQWAAAVVGVVIAPVTVAGVAIFALRAIWPTPAPITSVHKRPSDASHDSSDDEIDQTIPYQKEYQHAS